LYGQLTEHVCVSATSLGSPDASRLHGEAAEVSEKLIEFLSIT
jgi:hypothetical protein